MDGLEIRANPLGVLEAGWRKVMDAARLASPERPRNGTIRSASSKSARKDAPICAFVTSFLIGLNRIRISRQNYSNVAARLVHISQCHQTKIFTAYLVKLS